MWSTASTAAPTTTSPSRSTSTSCWRGSEPSSDARRSATRRGSRPPTSRSTCTRARCSRTRPPMHLTAREFELLVYLMRHPNQVLSREQILSAVWGYDFDPGTNVLSVYVNYLRRKLTVDGDPTPDRDRARCGDQNSSAESRDPLAARHPGASGPGHHIGGRGDAGDQLLRRPPAHRIGPRVEDRRAARRRPAGVRELTCGELAHRGSARAPFTRVRQRAGLPPGLAHLRDRDRERPEGRHQQRGADRGRARRGGGWRARRGQRSRARPACSRPRPDTRRSAPAEMRGSGF